MMKFCLTATVLPQPTATLGQLRLLGWRQPNLTIWFSGLRHDEHQVAQQFTGERDLGGALMVVHQDEQLAAVNRRSVSTAETKELTQLLKDAGLPVRVPLVEGRMDSSDVAVEVYLSGEIEHKPFSFELELTRSSYSGPDAQSFAAFCKYLLWLASLKHTGRTSGYYNESLWHMLTGNQGR